MLYNAKNLSVAKMASKSTATRPELTGVYFKRDRTVATDGVCLLEMTTPTGLDIADWPKVKGITAMRGCSPFIVKASMLAERVKLPKKASLPILECAAISHIADGHFVEFITTDLETTNRNRIAQIDGTFPDYEKIFPTGEPVAEITVNAEAFAGLLTVMSKLKNKVKISFHSKDKPLVLWCEDNQQQARGLMMGMKEW